MKTYFFTPLDTLFFREGQPFQQGETTSIESAFPPTPRTMQGAIRSCYLSQKGLLESQLPDAKAIEQAVGPPQRPLQPIEGPSLARLRDGQLESFLPLPFFWWRKGDNYRHRRFVGPKRLGSEIEVKNSWTQAQQGGFEPRLFPYPGDKAPEPQHAYLSWPQLRALLYAKEENLEQEFPTPEPHLRYETRTMVAIDEERGSQRDGMLNFTRQIRLGQDFGFSCRSGFELETPCVVPFGGLGRLCRIEALELAPDFKIPDTALDQILETGHFWLVLLQPARFPASWPESLDDSFFQIKGQASQAEQAESSQLSCRLKLIGAVVGPALQIGGFSFAQHRPAAQHAYAPAGSAYLFAFQPPKQAAVREPIRQALNALQGRCVLGDPDERRMGFGQVLVAPFFEKSKLY